MEQTLTLPPLVRGEWIPMSYDEFRSWAADKHGEWVDGKGILFVGASDDHQWIIDLLHDVIVRFALLFDLGRAIQAPFVMRFWQGGPHREPDIIFLREEHLDRWGRTGIIGPADLVVEVISDDSEERDLVDKMRAYAELGVPEYLVVDARPGRYWLGLHRLAPGPRYQAVVPDGKGRCHSEVLPGFWLDPKLLLRTPRPLAEEVMMLIAPDAYDALLADLRARLRQRREEGEDR